MSVSLRAIKFNHSAGSLSTDAMTIRKNKTEDIQVPEWKAGISVNAEDSKAAYAILETRGNTISIQAAFTHPGPSGNVQVRAIDATVVPPFTNWLYRPHRKNTACYLEILFWQCAGRCKTEVDHL